MAEAEIVDLVKAKRELRGKFMRALESSLIPRAKISQAAGRTFAGERNLETALGYKSDLTPDDYWKRYERGEVAASVVEAYPQGTWRGEGEVFDDPDNEESETEFEKIWAELAFRLQIWPTFRRGDTLAGLGQYAAILIGGPGPALNTPLPKPLKPEQIQFLQPYSQRELDIEELETSTNSPRFGEVTTYKLKRLTPKVGTKTLVIPERVVHWTRMVHIPADGLLENNIFGQPRLQRVWNRLDDLDKCVGGGSEASWLRAHPGYQLDLDKELQLDEEAQDDLDDEIEEFKHGISRFMQTRGVRMEVLNAEVANFDKNVDSILGLIAAGSKIPQRILSGSERGQLASQQDRVNWTERVKDRRNEFAAPYLVHQLVRRLVDHGVLPTPKDNRFTIWWPDVFDLSDDERAIIAGRWAEINQKNKSTVVLTNEIRGRILGLGPLDEKDIKKENEMKMPRTGKSAVTESPVVPPANPEDSGERPVAGVK
jgi:hypothetical protein